MTGGVCSYDSDRMEAQLSELHQQFPSSSQRVSPQHPDLLPDLDGEIEDRLVQHRVLSWPFDLSDDDDLLRVRPSQAPNRISPRPTELVYQALPTDFGSQLIDHPLPTQDFLFQDGLHHNPLRQPQSLLGPSPSSARMSEVDLMDFPPVALPNSPLGNGPRQTYHSHTDSQNYDLLNSQGSICPNSLLNFSENVNSVRQVESDDLTLTSHDMSAKALDQNQLPADLFQSRVSSPLIASSSLRLTHSSTSKALTGLTTPRLPYQESETSDTPPSSRPTRDCIPDARLNVLSTRPSHSPVERGASASHVSLSHSSQTVSAAGEDGLPPASNRSSCPQSPVLSPTPLAPPLSQRPSLDSGCGFDVLSPSPSPSHPFCPLSLSNFVFRDIKKKQKNKAPLSSTSRFKVFRQDSLCSSTNNSEIERGFTSEDDFERSVPLTNQTIQSMAGAPLPVVYELLQHPHSHTNSARSTPSNAEHPSSRSPSRTHHSQATGPESRSLRNSQGSSQLSSDNLRRQALSTSVNDELKKRSKLRDTEKWAREAAYSSQSHSPENEPVHSFEACSASHPGPPRTHSPITSIAAVKQEDSATEPQSHSSLISADQSQNAPKLVLHPVPFSCTVPVVLSGVTISSQAASVNEWLSETTQHASSGTARVDRTQDSRLDASDTYLKSRSSFSPDPTNRAPTISPGTLIGGPDNERLLVHVNDPDPPSHPYRHGLGPLSSPLVLVSESTRKPTSTPVSDSMDHDLGPCQLLQARISLQNALATTPQARSSHRSPSPPTPKQEILRHDVKTSPDVLRHYGDQSSDDSGLSPIKEDRTAELLAESSWRLKHNRSVSNSTTGDPRSEMIVVGLGANQTSPFLRFDRMNAPYRPVPAQSLMSQIESMDHLPETFSSKEDSHDQTPRASPNSVGREPQGDTGKYEKEVAQPGEQDDLTLPMSNYTESSIPSGLGSARSTPEPSLRPRSAHTKITLPVSDIRSLPSVAKSPPRAQTVPPQLPARLPSSDSFPLRNGGRNLHNPPPSLPIHARKAPPSDTLQRHEIEEWKNMTGIDDRCALSLKGYQHGIDSGPSVPTGSRRVIGLGGEERRGMKDRWGNAWGLESHLLSPLSERTERSLTTAASCLSLSTRQSMHSIRSIGSNGVYCQSNNSLAQRLNEAELNSLRHMSSPRSPLALTKAMMRSSSCPIKAGAEHATTVRVCEDQKLNLAEEKLKRKEARRIKREKRDQRRKEDHHRSESLAQKQERRRQEKERKEKFLEQKQALLQQIQVDPVNPTLFRDLGRLYLSCNAGIAGVRLAIRHLETSLQMSATDPTAWSSLGKSWAKLHALSEECTPNPTTDAYEAEKQQQAHNATIGLRKAILNSRSGSEAMKFKMEWAHYLERFGRWRESLGVLSEVISNEGKSDHTCWASLGFVGLRIGFGLAPLVDLESDGIFQGFQEDEDLPDLMKNDGNLPELTMDDRMKLLEQVGHAFQRAGELVEAQMNDSTQEIESLQRYRTHYSYQLNRLEEVMQGLHSRPASSLNPFDNTAEPRPPSHASTSLRHSRSQPDFLANGDRLAGHDIPAFQAPDASRRTSPLPTSGSETAKASTRCPSADNGTNSNLIDTQSANELDRGASMSEALPQANPAFNVSPQTYRNENAGETRDAFHNEPAIRTYDTYQAASHEAAGGSAKYDEKDPQLRDTVFETTKDACLVESPRDLSQPSNPRCNIPYDRISAKMFEPIPYSDSEHVLQYDDVDTTNEFSEDQEFRNLRYPQEARMQERGMQPSQGSIDRETTSVRDLEDSMSGRSINLQVNQDVRGPTPCDETRCSSRRTHHRSPSAPVSARLQDREVGLSGRSNVSHCSPDVPVRNLSPGVASSTRSSFLHKQAACHLLRSGSRASHLSIEPTDMHRSQACTPALPRDQILLASPLSQTWIPSPTSFHPAHSTRSHLQALPAADLSADSIPFPSQQPVQGPPRDTILGSPVFPAQSPDHEFKTRDFSADGRQRVRARHMSMSDHHSIHPEPVGDETRRLHSSSKLNLEGHRDALPDHYRERMLAFFELDQSYYSRTSQLRRRLLEVEEEHDRQRQEMINKLGLTEFVETHPPIIANTRLPGIEPAASFARGPSRAHMPPSHRSRSTCSRAGVGRAYNSSSACPSPGRPLDPQLRTPQQVLAAPVHMAQMSRVDGSEGRDGQADLHMSVEDLHLDESEVLPTEMQPPEEISKVMLSRGDAAQAEVALQGIAAILKLATTKTATTATTTVGGW